MKKFRKLKRKSYLDTVLELECCYIKGNQVFDNNIEIDSSEENMEMFNLRQIKQAKLTRQVYQALGTPSIQDFKAIVTMNAVNNLPITIEDIDSAELIFGPDIRALKGKTVRRKPAPVISNIIQIPRELSTYHQSVTLCIDILHTNGMAFLTTVSRRIMYQTAEFLLNQKAEYYQNVLDGVFSILNQAGFKITAIHCNNELQPIMKIMADVY
jgi:hypothetical protein